MAESTKKPLPPLILGIVTARMLADRRYPENLWGCDGAELRADGLQTAGILPAVEAFTAEKKHRGFTGPVFFTLRLRRDGGAWDDARAREREKLWEILAERRDPICDFLDIEIEEAESLSPEVWKKLSESPLKVMISHHAFVSESPSTWEGLLASMRSFHPDAVKFAVKVESLEEAAALLLFARGVAEQFSLSCVIGMDEAGRTTRVLSPLLGCPITYAFLEEGPVAPGQLPVKILRNCFAGMEGRPDLDSPEEAWIHWAEERIIRESVRAG